MKQAFFGLALGIGFAVLLVYFLMVVNFQSWLDPFIILMALPGALAGILWALFVTGTTLSVPGAHGLHHGDRRGHLEQHPDGHVRQRAAAAGLRRTRRANAPRSWRAARGFARC